MTATSLTIYAPNGSVLAATRLQPDWNQLSAIRCGIALYPNARLVLWNSLPGAGILTIGKIVVEFDRVVDIVPQDGRFTEKVRRGLLGRARTRLTIGRGLEAIPPRAGLRVRWGFARKAPTSVPYGWSGKRVTWHRSQGRNLSSALKTQITRPSGLGIWQVYGPDQPAPPGAVDRNGVSGWEQDPVGMTIRSDLVMNRMALGCHDENGNLMRLSDPNYTSVRGYGETLQLRAYMDSYDHPLRTNVLSEYAPYEARIVGTNRWNGFLPYDGQHTGCASSLVRAAAQMRDPIAIADMDVIANDLRMCRPDGVGSRDMAWRMDAYAMSEAAFSTGTDLANYTVGSQMPSGAFMRASYPYPFSPNPWMNYGMPSDRDAEQLMERDLTVYALGLYGKREAVARAMHGRPWPGTKFVSPAQRGMDAGAEYSFACGPADYYPWLGLGVLATLDLPWVDYALRQPTPEGKVCRDVLDLRDTLAKETLGREQTAMLLAKLWEIT